MLANERTVTRPYIMDKSMGAVVDLDAIDLPRTNAAAEMAHAAQRGWVWFRRWQGAVRVVDFQCRRIEVGQFLLVRLINPFLN